MSKYYLTVVYEVDGAVAARTILDARPWKASSHAHAIHDCDAARLEIERLRERVQELGQLAVARSTQDRAVERDELLQAAINFIQTLTGMTPPPIEVAPPEVFAPFRAFVEKIQEITDRRCAASDEPLRKRPVFGRPGTRDVDVAAAQKAWDAAQAQPAAPAQAVASEHLFELWWAEYMPEAVQAQAWKAWRAATAATAAPAQAGEPARAPTLIWDVSKELREAAHEARTSDSAAGIYPDEVRAQEMEAWATRLELSQAAFYEDVYSQCADAIAPLVDAGELPGSVVESVQMMIDERIGAARGAAQAAPAQAGENEFVSRAGWVESAMRVYLIAGDTEKEARECAEHLWSEADMDDLPDPTGAAMEDCEGRGAAQAARHVGDSRFESWYAQECDKGWGTQKQLARDAYAAGMGDYAAQAAPVDAAVQPGVLTVAARYFDWLQEHGRGTSFSTFVDEFGYQEKDCKRVYEVVVLPCIYAARAAQGGA